MVGISSAAVLIPVFNEAAMIHEVVAKVRCGFDLVVCVDDGSSDDSARAAESAGATVVRHSVNLGQGAALRTGFDLLATRRDLEHVVTFDADGQHRVEDAKAMVAHARETGVQVVLGTRAKGGTTDQPLLSRLTLRAGLWYSRRTSGLELTDTHNGLRVIRRDVLTLLAPRQRGMAHASEIEMLISRHQLTWGEHPVSIAYTDYSRSKGQSSLNAVNIVYDLVAARLNTPA
ncbi:glycosyltransferase family 2 protein [Nocardioides sp. GCM10027113]|uniref:glycosyltransferase family 2 protein n=1 Tax=unclassified Nocardioides TaxID=2615069 RepID=UPI003614797E